MVHPENSLSFFAAFQRPAWIVLMVAQMLLGLALFLTLILKFYMLVVGVEGCLEGSTTTANSIRCTGTLEIVAHFVIALAGFKFAEFMFQERPRAMLAPLMVAISGVFVLLLSGLTYQVATWSVAATLLTLMLAISAIIAAQVYLRSNNPRS